MGTKANSHNTHNRTYAFFKKEGAVIAWLLSLVIILAFANASTIQARFNKVNQRQAAEVPKASRELGVLQMNWQDNYSTAGGSYQPSVGNKLIVVTAQVINLQQRNVWLQPLQESYVIDSAGNKFQAVNAEVQNPFAAGIYGPQTAASGMLAYSIPRTGAHDPKWCYELLDVNGGGEPVCVALNKFSLEKSIQ